MHLDLRIHRVLLRTELRMIFRDRRILFTSILLPILVTPLLMVASRTTLQKRERTLQAGEYRYALTGERSGEVRELYRA